MKQYQGQRQGGFKLKNLTTISNIENLKTDKVVSMALMFSGCTSLEEVDVSKLKDSRSNRYVCYVPKLL